MEASQAGLAGGDAGQQQGTQADGQGGQESVALAQQLEALQGSQEELREFLMSQPWQAQEAAAQGEQQGEGDGLDLSELLGDGGEYLDPQALTQLINSVVDQRVQAATQPLTESQAEMRRTQDAERLVSEFPELGNPDVAREVVGVSRQIAEANNRPELANEPWFWRMTYMAGRAAETANQEGAETPGAAHLEGGGGAGPAGGGEVDLGEQIVSARRGNSVLPFG